MKNCILNLPLTMPVVNNSCNYFFPIRDLNIRQGFSWMIIENFIEIFECQMSFNSAGCENCLFLFEYFYPILLTIYSEPGACQTINTKISTIPMIMGPTLSARYTLLTCLYIYLFCQLPPPSLPSSLLPVHNASQTYYLIITTYYINIIFAFISTRL